MAPPGSASGSARACADRSHGGFYERAASAVRIRYRRRRQKKDESVFRDGAKNFAAMGLAPPKTQNSQKIFSLPKFTTQDARRASCRHRLSFAMSSVISLHAGSKLKMSASFGHFLKIPHDRYGVLGIARAILRSSVVSPARSARDAHRYACVNTSLSGALFFFMRWCNPFEVHIDSRVHEAIKPSHLFRRATWPRKRRRRRRRSRQ